MDRVKMMNSLVSGILRLIDSRLKDLQYNYFVDGFVQSINDDGSYNVKINGFVSKVKAINGNTYVPGDIVLIEVMNNNFSFKFILCKRP